MRKFWVFTFAMVVGFCSSCAVVRADDKRLPPFANTNSVDDSHESVTPARVVPSAVVPMRFIHRPRVLDYQANDPEQKISMAPAYIGSAIAITTPALLHGTYLGMTAKYLPADLWFAAGLIAGGIVGAATTGFNLFPWHELPAIRRLSFKKRLLFHTAIPLAMGLCVYTYARLSLPD